jgi:DNA-binding GntR family transcriptional regulator
MSSVAAAVERQLLELIRSEQFRPGDHIAHRPLAQRLGVSIIPVMHALRKLEGQGVVQRDADGSARVRSFTPHEVYAALALREAVEGAAAGLCAALATDEELAVLRVRFDRMVAAYHAGNYVPEEELAFHRGTVKFCHAPFLMHQYDAMAALRHTFTLRAGHRTAARLIAIHRPIMEAILARNAEKAEAEAREHVADARRIYRETTLPLFGGARRGRPRRRRGRA